MYSFFTFNGLWIPGYKPFTYGFRDRVSQKCDIESVQKWLQEVDRQLCTKQARYVSDAEAGGNVQPLEDFDWPDPVRSLDPSGVKFDLDENNNPKIRLYWGGAMAHWGVEIGSKDMKIPETKERTEEEISFMGQKQMISNPGEYRLPVTAGSYVWYGLD